MALGLQDDGSRPCSQRSLEDPGRHGLARRLLPGLVPASVGAAGSLAAVRRQAAGLFSGSAVPDFGGMMSALGTIGNSPASSGGGGEGSRAGAVAAAEEAPAAASDAGRDVRRVRGRMRRGLATWRRLRLALGRMGAVDTMEIFFERLNAGDRRAPSSSSTNARRCACTCGGSVHTLRGVDRVGGWFLRADKGFRMIPGDVRGPRQHVRGGHPRRPAGAPTQHLDATFRVEAGKITSINLAPRR